MPNNFELFVDESKNLVGNYPDQFADIINAPDITTKTYRDVEKAFLRIPQFSKRNIVMMRMSYGSQFSTPPKSGQDTPLQNNLNIYILTDKNDLIATDKSLLEKDKNLLNFLKMFIDMFDVFTSSKPNINSWSYLNREKYGEGIEEYLPINVGLIQSLIDKYEGVLQSESSSSSSSYSLTPSPSTYSSSSSASGGPPVSKALNEYSADEIKIIKGNGDIVLFKIDISEFLNYENIAKSNRFFKNQELGERIRDLIWSKEDVNIDSMESFDELFRALKKGGKLKKTRRKSKRQRGRKTKMRKRR